MQAASLLLGCSPAPLLACRRPGRPCRVPAGSRWPIGCDAALQSSRGAPCCPAQRAAAAAAARCLRWRRPAAAADSSPGGGPVEGEGLQERRFLRALLLAYLASQNRSLFAARCLVEVVLQLHREGATVDDVAVMLSLAGLQQGGALLEPAEQDVLLSYVAVVMMALDMVGVALLPEGERRRQQRQAEGGGAQDTSSMSLGLQGYVKLAVDQFLAGTDLYRLQLQQSMAGEGGGEGEAAGASPAVRMLQQNTRLVIITLEVVRDSGLPTSVPLDQPRTEAEADAAAGGGSGDGQAPAGGPSGSGGSSSSSEADAAGAQGLRPSHSHLPGFLLAFDPVALSKCGEEAQQRAAAVRLLISFMGAARGWLYPAWDLVQQTVECYSNGWTADDVYGRLNDEEFAQSGGIGITLARQAGGSNVSSLVLARWLSIIYMSLAQLRVVFPGATQQDGWAWVSGAAAQHDGEGTTTLEAYGLADFVLHTIRNEEGKERAAAALASASGSGGSGGGSGGGSLGEAEEPAVEGILSQPPRLDWQPQEGFVTVEDERLLSTSPTALLMSQHISLIQMTRQLVLQERARAAPLPAEA